jgi:hypothetical protein
MYHFEPEAGQRNPYDFLLLQGGVICREVIHRRRRAFYAADERVK